MLAIFAFLLVFPFDFISYTLSSVKSINLPLGMFGYFIAFFAVLIFFVLKKFRISDFYMIALLGLFLIPILLSGNSHLFDYFYWLKTFSMFFAGMMMYDYFRQNNSIFNNNFINIIFLAVLALSLAYKPDANYLRLADAFVVTALLLVSYQKKFIITLITAALSIFALYQIGSRAGLILFSCVAIILIYAKYGFWKFSIFVPPSLYFIYQFILSLNTTTTNYNDNRLLRLIFSRDTDTSLNQRNVLNEMGQEVFAKNPILGDFGYYRYSYGEGAYAHNYFSYLAEFGIVGGLFLVVFISLFALFIHQNRAIKTNYNLFIFSLSLFSILGVAAAKSYYWIIPFLAFGLLYRSVSTRKYWKTNE